MENIKIICQESSIQRFTRYIPVNPVLIYNNTVYNIRSDSFNLRHLLFQKTCFLK